jgi:hypothetical protein
MISPFVKYVNGEKRNGHGMMLSLSSATSTAQETVLIVFRIIKNGPISLARFLTRDFDDNNNGNNSNSNSNSNGIIGLLRSFGLVSDPLCSTSMP